MSISRRKFLAHATTAAAALALTPASFATDLFKKKELKFRWPNGLCTVPLTVVK
jgi:hypothetical protein